MPANPPQVSAARNWFAHAVVAALKPLLLLLLFLLATMPERLALACAEKLGALYHAGHREQILARMRTVLGADARGEKGEKLLRDYLRHIGLVIVEMARFYRMADAELASRSTIEGVEHLQHALAGGRGAVLFLNHLGNPGSIGAGIGLRGYDLTIAGNPMVIGIAGATVSLDFIERVLQRMFERRGVRRALLGQELPARLAAALKGNGLFAMFIDFPVVQKHTRALPFGPVRMTVNLGPALLAVRNSAPVLCVHSLRVGANRHALKIMPLPPPAPAQSARESAAQLTSEALRMFYPFVREYPAQWWPWDLADVFQNGGTQTR